MSFEEALIRRARVLESAARVRGIPHFAIITPDDAATALLISVVARAVPFSGEVMLRQRSLEDAHWVAAFLYLLVLPLQTMIEREQGTLYASAVASRSIQGFMSDYSYDEQDAIMRAGLSTMRGVMSVPKEHALASWVTVVHATLVSLVEGDDGAFASLAKFFNTFNTTLRTAVTQLHGG